MYQLTRREFVKWCGMAAGLLLAACGYRSEPSRTPVASNTPLPTSTSLPAVTTTSPAATLPPLVAALAATQLPLAPLPAHIVERLNSTLGMVGRPHFILYQGQWLDTGCMEWTPALTLHEALTQVSPALADALRRMQDYLAKRQESNRFNSGSPTYQGNLSAMMEEFFAKEPPSIQAEYDIYKGNLERASMANEVEAARKAGINVDRLRKTRDTLRGEKVVAYLDGPVEFPIGIVVASTNDQYDTLRIERTDAANYGMGTEDVIAKLKVLDEKYGIDIVQAGNANVQFVLKRIPKGNEARELERWLLDFCPDLDVYPQDLAGGSISLWWD